MTEQTLRLKLPCLQFQVMYKWTIFLFLPFFKIPSRLKAICHGKGFRKSVFYHIFGPSTTEVLRTPNLTQLCLEPMTFSSWTVHFIFLRHRPNHQGHHQGLLKRNVLLHYLRGVRCLLDSSSPPDRATLSCLQANAAFLLCPLLSPSNIHGGKSVFLQHAFIYWLHYS